MSLVAPDRTERAVEPLSLATAPSLIERILPAQKLSAEAQKERRAGAGQTLTALGSYWKGRKPLILARACVLGALLPATDDPERDLEVFEKLMAIDDAALDRRFHVSSKRISAAVAWHWLQDPKFESSFDLRNPNNVDWRDPTTISPREALELVEPKRLSDAIDLSGESPTWSETATERDVVHIQRTAANELRRRAEIAAFRRMPYTEKLSLLPSPRGGRRRRALWRYLGGGERPPRHDRPELPGAGRATRHHALWASTPRRRYFCGAGSIPFEAARLGCDVYASDLNPIGCLLTWGALNIVGGDAETRSSIERAQREIADAVDREITELGIEHDEDGNRAKAYLWCLEVQSPLTNGWRVPMATSWVISHNYQTYARLVPDNAKKRFEIEIVTDANDEELEQAKTGTVQERDLVWAIGDEVYRLAIRTLRGDYRQPDGSTGTGCADGSERTSSLVLTISSRSDSTASSGWRQIHYTPAVQSSSSARRLRRIWSESARLKRSSARTSPVGRLRGWCPTCSLSLETIQASLSGNVAGPTGTICSHRGICYRRPDPQEDAELEETASH